MQLWIAFESHLKCGLEYLAYILAYISRMSQSDFDSEAEALYAEEKKKNEADKVEEDAPQGIKRLKKHRKEERPKKRRHIEEPEEEENNNVSDFLDIEASEDDDEDDEIGDSELGSEEALAREQELAIYKKTGRNMTEEYLKRLENKNEEQINSLYRLKASKMRENEQMLPSESDHKMFSVMVRQGHEEKMVICILNKTNYYVRTGDPKNKMKITTVLAMKKKYPGKIFIEAAHEKDIKDSLEGFVDVNLGKIIPMDDESYSSLFETKEVLVSHFSVDNFVRIKKGVYENDIGKITKVKKNSVNILLVPRLNIQDIALRMKEDTIKFTDEKIITERRKELLKKFLNPRLYYPAVLRPPKKLLFAHDFAQWSQLSGVSRVELTAEGLIILSFRYDEFVKPQGTPTAMEIQPFALKNGRIIEEFQTDKQRRNLQGTVDFTKGDQAEIIVGELIGCYGSVVEVKDNTVTIKCRNKAMKDKVIEEHIDHVRKHFKETQRVKVVHGTDKGKGGIILSLEGEYAIIWTDNENTIKINKNNLQLSKGETINEQNVLDLRKDDLIKTTKYGIGIVLSTNKDTIKILDTNNTIQMISNLDYESKIMTANLVIKNKSGEVIKDKTIVRVKRGVNEGKKCEVRHVYRDHAFLFNSELDRTNGICVEKADNLSVIAKTTDSFTQGRRFPNKAPSFNSINSAPAEDDIRIGGSIVIPSGPLKGYRGIVKNVSKDKIEVRVTQKGCTEFIARDQINKQEESMENGKTPRRNLSMTAMYAQSPMNYP